MMKKSKPNLKKRKAGNYKLYFQYQSLKNFQKHIITI